MKTLEKGQDKIDKICAVLREETLEPAQKKAQEIIEQAQIKAEQIIADAQKTIEKQHGLFKAALEQERNSFQSALKQSIAQGLETLRQSIEGKFFNEHLSTIIENGASDSAMIANLMNAVVKALEKDGLAADLSGFISKNLVPRELNALLLQDVLKKLTKNSVSIGDFNAGIQLKLNDKKMTIDITEDALRELLATYVVRKDLRKMIFSHGF